MTKTKTKTKPPPDLTNAERQARWRARRQAELADYAAWRRQRAEAEQTGHCPCCGQRLSKKNRAIRLNDDD